MSFPESRRQRLNLNFWDLPEQLKRWQREQGGESEKVVVRDCLREYFLFNDNGNPIHGQVPN
jgi:hypothetical protein